MSAGWLPVRQLIGWIVPDADAGVLRRLRSREASPRGPHSRRPQYSGGTYSEASGLTLAGVIRRTVTGVQILRGVRT